MHKTCVLSLSLFLASALANKKKKKGVYFVILWGCKVNFRVAEELPLLHFSSFLDLNEFED